VVAASGSIEQRQGHNVAREDLCQSFHQSGCQLLGLKDRLCRSSEVMKARQQACPLGQSLLLLLAVGEYPCRWR